MCTQSVVTYAAQRMSYALKYSLNMSRNALLSSSLIPLKLLQEMTRRV